MTPSPPLPDRVTPDVCVVIVNYNGGHFLDACLASLQGAFVRHRHEVIVIDNASSDGSQALLRARTDIEYIESDRNLGFTGGNNRAALAARAPLLLLLNNDTWIPAPLDALVERFRDEHVGVAGCRLTYGDGRCQPSVGYEHSPLRLLLSWLGLAKLHFLPSLFRRLETDAAFYARRHDDVAWLSGACLLTRTALWHRLGGFDEDIFMYCEDVDYCRRVRALGRRVVYDPAATVVHYEGAGKPWIGAAAMRRTCRSYLLYLQKHYGTVARCIVAPCLAAAMLARAAWHALQAACLGGRPDGRIAAQKRDAFASVGRFLLTTWDIEAERGRGG